MSEQSHNSELAPRDSAAFVAHWIKAGALLQKVRRAELRDFDYEKHREAIMSLLDLAVAHAPPRTTSGLVEQQRLFMEAARRTRQ
jgi:hypothetical protein